MLLSYIMACGSQCHQRQYRRQGTKLYRYRGITKHRKERSLRGRMLLVTLQHDLTSTLDSGVQADTIVLEFSKAFDRVPTIQFTREATPRWHQGIPNSRSHTSFLAEPSVAVEGCSSESVPVLRGGVQDNSDQNQLGPHKTRPMPTRPKMQNSAHANSAQFKFYI